MAERVTEGTLLQVDKTTIPGATWVKVADVNSIDGPSESVSSLDKTTLTSTAREFRPGLYQGGEISFELNFDPANTDHSWVHTTFVGKSTKAWRIFIPAESEADDDYGISFLGFITECGLSAGGPDEFLVFNVTIQITGGITYAAIAGA